VALFVGTDFGRLQDWLLRKKLGMDPPVIFQISVPLLGWVGWQAVRLLGSPLEDDKVTA